MGTWNLFKSPTKEIDVIQPWSKGNFYLNVSSGELKDATSFLGSREREQDIRRNLLDRYSQEGVFVWEGKLSYLLLFVSGTQVKVYLDIEDSKVFNISAKKIFEEEEGKLKDWWEWKEKVGHHNTMCWKQECWRNMDFLERVVVPCPVDPEPVPTQPDLLGDDLCLLLNSFGQFGLGPDRLIHFDLSKGEVDFRILCELVKRLEKTMLEEMTDQERERIGIISVLKEQGFTPITKEVLQGRWNLPTEKEKK